MKNTKRALSVLLCLIMMFGTVAVGGEGFSELLDALSVRANAASSGTCGENLTWSLSDDGVMTITGTGEMDDYEGFSFDGDGNYAPWRKSVFTGIITSVVISSGVTTVGENAFYEIETLTSVSLPSTLTEIGEHAFDGCKSITNLTLPSSLKIIGRQAFSKCAFSEITLPKDLEDVGKWSFEDCNNLKEIKVNSANAYYSSENGVLYNKDKSELIRYPIGNEATSYTVNSNTIKIGDSAFENAANLTEIVLPEGIESLGWCSFSECINLTKMDLPNSLTEIDAYAFGWCAFEQVEIPQGVKELKTLLFRNNTKLKSAILPEGIERIDSLFSGCSSLETVNIPSSVKEIKYASFEKCSSLDYVDLPDTITKICSYAFNNCSNLNNIYLPLSLTEIEYHAFEGCSSLSNVYYQGTKEEWNAITIDINNDELLNANIHFNSNSVLEYDIVNDKVVITGCDKTVSGEFRIPAIIEGYPVTSIGESAFYQCNDLTNIIIPDGVVAIEDCAFMECLNLNSVTIPDSVKIIGDAAFADCISLENITIPDSVTSLGSASFVYCTALTGIEIPENVTVIGDITFFGCADLDNVTLPSGLKQIGEDAFNCHFDADTLAEHRTRYNDAVAAGDSEINGVPIEVYEQILAKQNGVLSDVYFNGSHKEWNELEIGDNNDNLINANIHFLKEKYSVTFFVDGSEILSDEYYVGDTIIKPNDPSKTGYVFAGWIPDVPETMPAQDLEFCAQWTKVNNFDETSRYSFSNSHYSFFGHNKVDDDKDKWCDICQGAYYMTQFDYDKIISYINKIYTNPSPAISSVQFLRNKKYWNGSCYGMAVTSILDYQNKIAFNENFDNGAKTMWDVSYPYINDEVASAINYYMVSQYFSFIRNSIPSYNKEYYPSSWTPGLKELVSTAQEGEPFLFCYYWLDDAGGRHGHAIVALYCTTNFDGSFSITAYDNRYPNKDIIIKVDSSYTSCVVNGTENAYGFEYYPDMSGFDRIDIDGPENDMNINYYTYNGIDSNDEITVVANGDVTVTNTAGETISIVDGDINSSMNVISIHMIVRDTEDGNAAPVEFVFEVEHSKSYYFESDNDNMAVSVKTNEMYGAATSKGADYIAVGDDGVYVIGDKMEYSAALSSKDSEYDTVLIEGTAKRDVSLTYLENDILINGANGNGETIAIFANEAMNPENFEIKEGYSAVKIVAENNRIDIKASSNNDGNYDISVVLDNNEEPVNPTASAKLKVKSSATVDYRSKVNITATASGVPKGYYVAIYDGKKLLEKGDNTKVVFAPEDSNGKPLELKTDKTYTVKIIDAKGNVQKDANGKDLTSKIEIKVKQGFFDKFIAFFKGLFRLLPTVEIKP